MLRRAGPGGMVGAMTPESPLRRPELLAPAGDWECARAAVENGADAIYFGLERFNARMRAHNFTQADLPALMAYLHGRGVRGYVTFNTLVFTDELGQAQEYLRSIIAAGVDAAIVQDVGICDLIRRLSPDFPIHGSTQMTVTSAAGVRFARSIGADLVVLARENTIADISSIRATLAAEGLETPLEVFVHGALCVAYSGQCLTSESLGGRSANRGECAQACRLPYGLVSDGREVELGDRRYLLSPQDLAGLDVLPELVRAGVASLKIEGRLKSPEYVAGVTRVYREALDAVCGVKAAGRPAARYELEMSFSRGLHTGWFGGIDNQKLVHARFGTKRGVFLGEVTRVDDGAAVVRLQAPVKPGDGVVFDAGNPEGGEEGGRVYDVTEERGPQLVRLGFGRGDIAWRRVAVGNRVWKTSDPALERDLRASFEGDKVRHRRPVRAEVHGRAGTALTLLLDDGQGHVVRADSEGPLERAESQPLTQARLEEQLGRLGGTPFVLGSLANSLEGAVILPVAQLNALRRRAVEALTALRTAPRRWTLREESPRLEPLAAEAPEARGAEAASPGGGAQVGAAATAGATAGGASGVDRPVLIAVVRDMAQLEAAIACPGIGDFYCEFENPKRYRDAVALFRGKAPGAASAGADPSARAPMIWVAPPRVFKPGEGWILEQVLSSQADGYLVRNADHLAFFARERRRGDFSLNVANPWTARRYRAAGLERVTASYDLNAAQLEALLAGAPAGWFDITIHQHMPLFHMEHCVFCAFLSEGRDYRDCGRPCEKHAVALRDRVGADLPLKADAGCRNTVYNNRAQTGAEFLPRFLALGARHFRVEFVWEKPEEVAHTLGRYRALLDGTISGAGLWREMKLINQLGVTRGQMAGAGAPAGRSQG